MLPADWRGEVRDPSDGLTGDRALLDERERAYAEVEERDRNAWRKVR